ncbi:3966_t:CDS:1, partial [Ambispora leptoticha]
MHSIIAVENQVSEGSSTDNPQDIVMTQQNVMDKRQEKYIEYKKKFKKVLELYIIEIGNENFVK